RRPRASGLLRPWLTNSWSRPARTRLNRGPSRGRKVLRAGAARMPFSSRQRLPRGDEAAVDGEVRASDVARAAAAEEEHEVGDLAGLGEPAGDHLAGGLAGHVLGLGAGGVAD